MSIGKRNRLVEIWKHSGALDAANRPVPDDMVLHARKWAEVKGEGGMATIRAAGASGNVNTPLDRYSYRIDYDTSITVKMQLRDPDGTRGQVIGVRHDKADREWTDVIVEFGGSNG